MKTKFHLRHFECFVFVKPEIYKYKMYRELMKTNHSCSSRYNFTKQKLAFLLYKITRSDGGGKLFSVVLDTFLSRKSWALQLKNTRSNCRVIVRYFVIFGVVSTSLELTEGLI